MSQISLGLVQQEVSDNATQPAGRKLKAQQKLLLTPVLGVVHPVETHFNNLIY